jgi:hypothetical protein
MEQVLDISTNPFGMGGLMWIVWFALGIFLVWIDLVHKVQVASLSIAAFITVFSPFFVPVSSQVLIFAFFSALIYMGKHVHKEHHAHLKHFYIH